MTWTRSDDGMPTAEDIFGAQRGADTDPAPAVEEPSRLTDAGNAEDFATLYGSEVRFDHRRARWLLWRGHRWQPDADAEVRRLAKVAMRERFRDAALLDDPEARARAAKWAIASESRGRLDALLYLCPGRAADRRRRAAMGRRSRAARRRERCRGYTDRRAARRPARRPDHDEHGGGV